MSFRSLIFWLNETTFFFHHSFGHHGSPHSLSFFSYMPSLSLLSLLSSPIAFLSSSSSSFPACLCPFALLCIFFIYISHFLSPSILSPAEKRFKTDYQNPSTHPQFILWVCELWKQALSWHQPLTFSEIHRDASQPDRQLTN